MKSQKAKEAIERYRRTFSAPYQVDETAEYCRLFKEIAELAEQEAFVFHTDADSVIGFDGVVTGWRPIHE